MQYFLYYMIITTIAIFDKINLLIRPTDRLSSESFFVCHDLSLNSNLTHPLQ